MLEIPLSVFNGGTHTSTYVFLDHGLSYEAALVAQGFFQFKGYSEP